MTKIRLGSVSLDCGDPHALGEFWAALLGGEVAFSSDSFVAVKLEGLWLSAVKVDDHQPPSWPDGLVPKQIHLDLSVSDLEAAESEAIRLGASKAALQPGEGRFNVLIDPAGHPFCLSTQIPD